MSQLPKGTLAARSFVDSIIIKGAMAEAKVFWAPLAWPGISNVLEALLERLLIKPPLDEASAIGLAVIYLIDRTQFDKKFIELSMLDKQGASPQRIEMELQNAQNAMARFIRRGPIS